MPDIVFGFVGSVLETIFDVLYAKEDWERDGSVLWLFFMVLTGLALLVGAAFLLHAAWLFVIGA